VIISESVARLVWPNQNAVGKRISMANHPGPGDWLTVIGVAHDIVQDRALTPQSTVYLPYLQTDPLFFINHMTYVVRTAPGAVNVPPAMRAALRGVDATIPAQALQTMDASMLDVVAEPLFQTRLLTTFSILALLLAAIGTYGVLAYDVAERTREIGIRIALGASVRDVRRLVIGRTLVFATVGIVLGTLGAFAATRLLTRFLFLVAPTDPATFVGTGGRADRRGARGRPRSRIARDPRRSDPGAPTGVTEPAGKRHKAAVGISGWGRGLAGDWLLDLGPGVRSGVGGVRSRCWRRWLLSITRSQIQHPKPVPTPAPNHQPPPRRCALPALA
jgi:hypothetical protein